MHYGNQILLEAERSGKGAAGRRASCYYFESLLDYVKKVIEDLAEGKKGPVSSSETGLSYGCGDRI